MKKEDCVFLLLIIAPFVLLGFIMLGFGYLENIMFGLDNELGVVDLNKIHIDIFIMTGWIIFIGTYMLAATYNLVPIKKQQTKIIELLEKIVENNKNEQKE